MEDNIKEEVLEGEFENVVEESKFKGFISKVGTGIKKHGKKVAVLAAAGTAGLIGYALGSRSKNEDWNDDNQIDDEELLELMDSKTEVTEEE